MSQRNPMNDRYQTDEHLGKTRRSAASAKPKTKAAASVRVQPKVKSKQQKKADQRAARSKQSQLDRMYYNPPTPEYKRLRKIWWGLLIGALACLAVTFAGESIMPDPLKLTISGVAYGCIIGALYLELAKIRKVRRAYQAAMQSKKSKELRAVEKQLKAAERAEKLKGEDAPAEAGEAEQPKKQGLFGGGSPLSFLGLGRSQDKSSQQAEAADTKGTASGEQAKTEGAEAAKAASAVAAPHAKK